MDEIGQQRYSGDAPRGATPPALKRGRARRFGASVLGAVAVGITLLPLLAIGPGRAAADDAYTPIGDSPVRIQARYFDTDTNAWLTLPVPPTMLPNNLQAQLTQPLGRWFDNYWSVQPGPDGQTPHDAACDRSLQETAREVHDHTGQSAHDITCNLSTSGELSARVVNHDVELDYHLGGNSLSFSVTTPDVCVVLCVGAPEFTDPRFSVSFDVDLDVHIQVPEQLAPLTVSWAVAQTGNASVSGANATGELVSAVDSIVQFVGGTGIYPPVERAVNEQTQDMTGQLAAQLNPLSAGLTQAGRYGFDGLEAAVDDSQLTLRLVHSIPAAPLLTAGYVTDPGGVPSLTHPGIVAAQAQVRAGGQVVLSGQDFPSPTASQLPVSWSSSGIREGVLDHSEVEWGPQGGALRRDHIARHPYDSGGFFSADQLDANRTYRFHVRDCDPVACSLWSDWQTGTTNGATSGVAFYLDGVKPANNIGSGTVAADGSFQTTVTVPGGTSAGRHTLIAVAGAAQAQTGIDVVARGQSVQPVLRVVGGPYGATSFMQGDQCPLRGEGFAPGQVTIYLDAVGGQVLATATAGNDGTFQVTFQVPYTIAGSHTLVAHEQANGTSLDASQQIFVQTAPR